MINEEVLIKIIGQMNQQNIWYILFPIIVGSLLTLFTGFINGICKDFRENRREEKKEKKAQELLIKKVLADLTEIENDFKTITNKKLASYKDMPFSKTENKLFLEDKLEEILLLKRSEDIIGIYKFYKTIMLDCKKEDTSGAIVYAVCKKMLEFIEKELKELKIYHIEDKTKKKAKENDKK